ncbi:MAG TPA: ribonuclease III [Bacillota bacterium]|nr:ribonuclease III [Candidatus Fermentithermobacillaceae bacterium]HPP60196.1 ribonuclease III [Bacillota bacterium]
MPSPKKVRRLERIFEEAIHSLDDDLRDQACTHVSYSNEKGEGFPSNERLEFLGDAVISLAVASYLYNEFPHLPEGELTRLRASLVSGASLAEVAQVVGLGAHLKLGKGEEMTGGRTRPSVLAGALEAVIGAYFIQYGWDMAKELVISLLINEEISDALPLDPKSLLQEQVQKTPGAKLEYKVVQIDGPDHNPYYTVACLINGTRVSIGKGGTKKEAEENAARKYLEGQGLLD